MEVVVDGVSSLVRGWLSQSPASRPLPLYQPVSPRPERLGLGAELSVKNAQPRVVTDNKMWQSVSGKSKSCLPSKSMLEDVVPDCRVHESCSDDDTSCSRSAAIGSAKRKLPPTSFTTEMAQSRKRRRRKKKDKTVEQDTNSIDKDKVNRGSVHTTSLLTQPVSDGRTSTHIMTMLENSLQTNSATTCGGESSMDSGTFQLFVHIEGDGDGEKPTCVSKHRQEQVLESKQSQCEKVKMKRRQALRGGSAHYCNKRMRKRLLKNSGLCETKHHPSTELSNFLTSSTSVGAPQSKGVGKQGALYDEGHDNLKGKELRLSPTPPVDTGHHTTEVTQYEGSKTDREASLEKGRHRRRVTRENSRHRRMVVMRYRKGRRSTQNSSDSLIKKLYLRKI